MQEVESRLAAVERQLRIQRIVITGLLVALVALVGYGATEGVPDVVRARKFEAIRSDGVVGIKVSGDSLTVFDNEGQKAATSTRAVAWKPGTPTDKALDIGAAFILYHKGLRVAQFMPSPEGAGELLLTSANHDGRIWLKMADSGGMINVTNKTGDEVVQIYADEYGVGYIGAFNRQGRGRTLTPR